MFASIRRDHVADAVRRDEVAHRLCDGLLPALSRRPGFVAAYILTVENGDVISVAFFSDRAQAVEASRQAADWVSGHLAALVPDPAGVVLGEVWGRASPA